MRILAAAAAVVLLISSERSEARVRPAAKNVWRAPRCTIVTGTGAVTFTRDEGATLAPTSEVAVPVNYTYGLAATDVPNRLYALHGESLLRSDDAGCTWLTVSQVRGWDFPPYLLAGAGGRVYGWSDNRDFFFTLEGDTAVRRSVPVGAIAGLAVDAIDGNRLRIAGIEGSLRDSFDGGVTWSVVFSGLPSAPWFYRFTFEPHDLDHIVAGSGTRGAFTTFNGGGTWIQATGLGDQFNVFSIAISPVDGNVVWARAINTADDTRHLYRSTDGGRSFERFLSDSAEVTLANQPLLVAHPTDPNVLYFVFGTFFQGYGTVLYRYDAALQQLTKTNNGYDEIVSMAFNPGDPSVMYVGIAEEQ
jgi:photosystem II stability/assembly factor-like uncharacterized protein